MPIRPRSVPYTPSLWPAAFCDEPVACSASANLRADTARLRLSSIRFQRDRIPRCRRPRPCRAISQKPPDSLSRPQDVGGGDGLAAGQSYSEDLRARVLAAVDGGFVLRPQTDITRRDEA